MGAGVLVISFEPVERLPAYRGAKGWRFPVVSDPTRASYSAFGLGSAGWRGLWGPRVIRRYLGLLLRGYRIERSEADIHQLGGDFIVNVSGKLVYSHRSRDPADRPSLSEWFSALERASLARPGA